MPSVRKPAIDGYDGEELPSPVSLTHLLALVAVAIGSQQSTDLKLMPEKGDKINFILGEEIL